MKPEIKSQFERTEELFENLLRELGPVSLENKDPTLRAQNIAHEILIKVRSTLDQVMYILVQSINGSVPANQKVYFPIASDNIKFEQVCKKLNIETSSTPIHIISKNQPYNSDDWLDMLNKYAILGKHIKLIRQRKTFTNQFWIHDKATGSTVVTRNIESTAEIFGSKINPETGTLEPVPGLEISKGTIIGHVFEDTGREVVPLCRTCIDNARKLVEELEPYLTTSS